MKRTYSLYEAKAKLSEIIRQVRERGVPVTISYHGKPVVEIRPVDETGASDDPMEARIREMIANGTLIGGSGKLQLKPLGKVPGALQRFLDDRNRF